jgi:MbtH protein
MDTPEPAPPHYRVVSNHDGHYSLWPLDRDLPPGWSPEGTSGPREQCLARIKEIWTDLRPRSLREALVLPVS